MSARKKMKKSARALDGKFYTEIREIIQQARNRAYRSVNYIMVEAYWNVGRRIVEEEQKGKRRAEYGKFIIRSLADRLTHEFGRGFDERNLRNMRAFYRAFPILNAVRSESMDNAAPGYVPIRNALRSELEGEAAHDQSGILHAVRGELSWTHYRLLLKVAKEDARTYYMDEAIAGNWSTRQLERQINSHYYERLLASRNKALLKKKTSKLERPAQPCDLIKDPFVLEFLDIKKNTTLQEKELESLLIGKLQDFLLELGRGFSFVGRQHRISADTEHYYIDLVFYNYLLKCFVLIDLKMGKLTHQDIGQMDFYVRYFEDKMRTEDDSPTIGIVLCSEKNETIVKYSLLKGSKRIFASKYKLYLPTAEELKRELERDRELIEREQKLSRDS